jgi:hypothetical protein
VVDAMGGVVEDADGMNREWSTKSRDLCARLNSIALPLGSLRIGLSRHRSLLFKVSYVLPLQMSNVVTNIPTVANLEMVNANNFHPVIYKLYYVTVVQSFG